MSKLALELIAKEKKKRTGKLGLGRCGLSTLPDELLDLVWLKELTLRGEWQNGEVLGNLTKLKTLDLGECKPKDWSFMTQLTNLTNLELIDCDITDIGFLENLTRLTSLELTYNNISDARALSRLTKLTNLELDNNKIRDLSFLEQLTALKSLNLENNNVHDLQFLKGLFNLKYLNLSRNDIVDTSTVGILLDLPNLISLAIAENPFFTAVPDVSYFFQNHLPKVKTLLGRE